MATFEEALNEVKASKSLTMGNSAFVTGAKFKILGFDYDKTDTIKRPYPVFVTNLGNLSVQSLLRSIAVKPYVDKESGETITTRQPQGEFQDVLRAELTKHRGKTNEEVLPLLVEAFKDSELIVRKREYVATESAYGGDTARPLCHVDFVHN